MTPAELAKMPNPHEEPRSPSFGPAVRDSALYQWRFPAKDIPQFSNIHYKEEIAPKGQHNAERPKALLDQMDWLLGNFSYNYARQRLRELGTDPLETPDIVPPNMEELWRTGNSARTMSARSTRSTTGPSNLAREDELPHYRSSYTRHRPFAARLGDEQPKPSGKAFKYSNNISRSARDPPAQFNLVVRPQYEAAKYWGGSDMEEQATRRMEELAARTRSPGRNSRSNSPSRASPTAGSPRGRPGSGARSPQRSGASTSPGRTGFTGIHAAGMPPVSPIAIGTVRSGGSPRPMVSPLAVGSALGSPSSPRPGFSPGPGTLMRSGTLQKSARSLFNGSSAGTLRTSEEHAEMIRRYFMSKGLRPPANLLTPAERKAVVKAMDRDKTETMLRGKKQDIVEAQVAAAMAESYKQAELARSSHGAAAAAAGSVPPTPAAAGARDSGVTPRPGLSRAEDDASEAGQRTARSVATSTIGNGGVSPKRFDVTKLLDLSGMKARGHGPQ